MKDAPYSDRQLIVVSEDAVANQIKKASEESTQSHKSDDINNIVNIIHKSLFSTNFFILPTAITLAKEAVKLWQKAQYNGIKVNIIGKSEAKQFIFPPGHPRDGVLYIAHPAIHNIYFVASDFHRVVFEHKLSEAIELLMSLGAVEIQVEHVRGWSKEFSANLSVPLGNVGGIAGGDISAKSKGGSNILYKANLSGTHSARLPDNLVWYSHEPTWQAIANGRLRYGLRDFSISVSYEDDFGVNAGLKAMAVKSGFDLGGKFEDHEATLWRIEGKFSPYTGS